MQERPRNVYSDEEYAMLHVLQLSPRIAWSRAAEILQIHPVKLANLWNNLLENSLAWVTCYPVADLSIALVDLDLTGSLADKTVVINRLAAVPAIVSIEETVGSSNLTLTVMTHSLAVLKALLLDELPAVEGSTLVRTRLATAMHRHGGNWHFDALTPEQIQKSLRTANHAPLGKPTRARFAPALKPVVVALMANGRTTAAALAAELGRPETTVRRQIGEVLNSGKFALRTEVAQLTTKWPVMATWYAHISPRHLNETVAAIATLSETRLCLSLAGPSNFALSVWAESLADVLHIEVMLSTKLPHLEIHHSAISLRVHKRMGWLIDAEGRNTGVFIPPDTIEYS